MIELKNHSQILRKEIQLKGVWNSIYSDALVNEWKYTVDMMDQEKLQVEDLITHKAGLSDVCDLFHKINNHEITICKAIYSAKCNERK